MFVYWGGDFILIYMLMVEMLCGGLLFVFFGFVFWSYDIGGFEGMFDVGVFKCWIVFGLFGLYLCFYGLSLYWVLWVFDEEVVEVMRQFMYFKMCLMLYFFQQGFDVVVIGVFLLWLMVLEFLDDFVVVYLDWQYMFGLLLLVVLVFMEDGEVEFYFLFGVWMLFFIGEMVSGGGWWCECYGFDLLLLYVCFGIVLFWGVCVDCLDYDYYEGF